MLGKSGLLTVGAATLSLSLVLTLCLRLSLPLGLGLVGPRARKAGLYPLRRRNTNKPAANKAKNSHSV